MAPTSCSPPRLATGRPRQAGALLLLDSSQPSPPGHRDVTSFLGLLEQGRLRLDVVAQAGLLEPLVAGGLLTQAQLDALVARAKEPAPVAEYDVRVAIYADDGSLRV